MLTINDLSRQLSEYMPTEQVNLVRRAYLYAEQAHDGQYRYSGEPYITHPLCVANILADMRMDHQSLMAGMLHDVIEDTPVAKQDLQTQFGEVVTELVDGVSKLTQIKFENRATEQAENFQKMALAMAKDIRVIIVKLADRLHNMRTLGPLKSEKRRRIAKETLDIYAPIANRLGVNKVCIELEELGLTALYPMRAAMIEKAIDRIRGNRKEVIEQVQRTIVQVLEQEGLPARVISREKHLNSVFREMKKQRKLLSQIMDVYAFRIITDRVDSCYRILGVMHNIFKPVPDRFKDYIAIPKANGYQSLHTTLFGMDGVPIEVQIRTEDMETMANNGIAAHWLYNGNGANDEVGDRTFGHDRARRWVRGLLEMQQRAGDPIEFIEHVKIDLFPDEIYVFTPKGKILELPKGATAIDFAYAVHTDIGNKCVACRVDRHLSPLSSVLQSGQTIEIITAANATPNPAWLNFAATGKARSTIRHFLKRQQRSQSVALGQRLLDKSLAAYDSSIEKVDAEHWQSLLKEIGVENQEDLYEAIGLGNRMASQTALRLLDMDENQTLSLNMGDQVLPLAINGTEGMVVSFAKCCRPIPGDPILAHISTGRGLVIHARNCKNISNIKDDPEKCMRLHWDKQVDGEFSVALKVVAKNKRGIIASIASVVTDANADIDKISVHEQDAETSVVHLSISVVGRKHLAYSMRRIRGIKAVDKVLRLRTSS